MARGVVRADKSGSDMLCLVCVCDGGRLCMDDCGGRDAEIELSRERIFWGLVGCLVALALALHVNWI